jgi:membrane protease YdiL (CAAX protease family)
MAEAAEAPRTPTLLRATLVGLLIAFASVAPWIMLAPLNARFHPELPWAALATAAYLAILLAWLNGAGPPAATRDARRRLLRLWRPAAGAWRGENLLAILGLAFAAAALYPLWIVLTPRVTPDLSAYPTTAYRMSVLVMGAVVSGVVEEAAFRGYMLSQLERFGAGFAVVVMAAVFVLSHLTHGLAMLPLAPGLFIAGVIYGHLALRTGSILPGMLIHSIGDASVTYFGLLGGDASLLIAA